MVIGHRSLVIGHCSSVIGHQSLVIGLDVNGFEILPENKQLPV